MRTSLALERVCIIGSGNWGSAVAKIVGNNVLVHSTIFAPTVNMWVYEEYVEGRKLTEIINERHENIKYLPGIKLPDNVLAVPDVVEAARDATLLVFVIPHQFVEGVCHKLVGNIQGSARAISLIKGIDIKEGSLHLVSASIYDLLGIDVSVLMGANIANEVAQEQFCEATLGYRCRENAETFQQIFNTSYFRVRMIKDAKGVELCGGLKNVVALAAGFVDGLRLGENTKAAVIRIGLDEMRRFCKACHASVCDETFFESCGIADLITTCFGGRNRRVAEAHIVTGKSIDMLEQEMLNGQKLQGPPAAKGVYHLLVEKDIVGQFPLLHSIYRICFEGLPAEYIFKCI